MKWYLISLIGAATVDCVAPGIDESEAIGFARREAATLGDIKDVKAVEVSAEEATRLSELVGLDPDQCEDNSCEGCYKKMGDEGYTCVALAEQLADWRGVVQDEGAREGAAFAAEGDLPKTEDDPKGKDDDHKGKHKAAKGK